VLWCKICGEVRLYIHTLGHDTHVFLNLAEKNQERSTLSSHASHISPEAQHCEHLLSCSIEGVEYNRLLIRYYRLDPSDAERDASLVLDVSSQNYKGVAAAALRSYIVVRSYLISYSYYCVTTSVIDGYSGEHAQRD